MFFKSIKIKIKIKIKSLISSLFLIAIMLAVNLTQASEIDKVTQLAEKSAAIIDPAEQTADANETEAQTDLANTSGTKGEQASEASEAAPDPSTLELKGIIIRGKQNKFAYINKGRYREGEEVDGFTVKEIQEKQVIVEDSSGNKTNLIIIEVKLNGNKDEE